jgi:diguanylate cyclase (GGDEF)-like protein
MTGPHNSQFGPHVVGKTSTAKPVRLSIAARDVVGGALQSLINHLSRIGNSLNQLGVLIQGFPPSLSTAVDDASRVKSELYNQQNAPFLLASSALPIVRTALLRERREAIRSHEVLAAKVADPALVSASEQRRKPLDELISAAWMAGGETQRVPNFADFVHLNLALHAANVPSLSAREFEPKARLLLASALVEQDLEIVRAECELRGVPLLILFLDLDHFKDLNARLTEPRVDREVLPRIMQAIEQEAYSRGFAYRYGGDEFIVMVPNCDRKLARALIERLRDRLHALVFPDIEWSPRMSVGYCIVEPPSPLGEREIIERVAAAKRQAKTVRDAVAFVADHLHNAPEIEETARPG